jgi:peroxiredoxin (alkyl hydroperoxide reductase subunit C)
MTLVGKPAPDFKLQAYDDGEIKEVSLSDYKGKWVYLLFYPLDFTFVCPTEVLKFGEMAGEFRKRNCELLGISVDSQFVHKAWVETDYDKGGLGGKLDYPLVADVNKQAARDYGVLIEDAGVALRGLFLIDPDGVVIHNVTNFLPVGRSAKEALRTLKAFQFVSENDGQVCPADWDEGDDTMGASSEGMQKYLVANHG